MLKQDFTLQILNQANHCLKEKIKIIGLIKYELGEKTMKEIVRLIAKAYSYSKYNKDVGKKAKCLEIVS